MNENYGGLENSEPGPSTSHHFTLLPESALLASPAMSSDEVMELLDKTSEGTPERMRLDDDISDVSSESNISERWAALTGGSLTKAEEEALERKWEEMMLSNADDSI